MKSSYTLEEARAYRAANREHIRATHYAWCQTEKGKESNRRRALAWQARNKEKKCAHTLLYQALMAGKLVKGRCEVCQSAEVEGHHDDYTKPLEVRWLCTLHHKHHHMALREAA